VGDGNSGTHSCICHGFISTTTGLVRIYILQQALGTGQQISVAPLSLMISIFFFLGRLQYAYYDEMQFNIITNAIFILILSIKDFKN